MIAVDGKDATDNGVFWWEQVKVKDMEGKFKGEKVGFEIHFKVLMQLFWTINGKQFNSAEDKFIS